MYICMIIPGKTEGQVIVFQKPKRYGGYSCEIILTEKNRPREPVSGILIQAGLHLRTALQKDIHLLIYPGICYNYRQQYYGLCK